MSDPVLLTCRELIAWLGAYLDGELTGEERSAFDAHLAVCPDCVSYLEAYRTTSRLGAAALGAEEDLPPDVPEDLVRAILASRRR